MDQNLPQTEEDAGFFITGINTNDSQQPVAENIVVDEQEIYDDENYNSDPADLYQHVAIVDFTNAFSSQEVSFYLKLTLFL